MIETTVFITVMLMYFLVFRIIMNSMKELTK